VRRPLPSRRIRRPAMAVAAKQGRRRLMVGLAKRLLPLAALALLAAVALWPELVRESDQARMSYRRGNVVPENGQMVEAIYHGVDTSGRPYTMTAATARQVSPDRINLTEPKGDISLASGNWLMVQGHRGVYLPHTGSLDLSDDVQIYRDDGTTLTTSSGSLDLKQGAAAGAEMVHVEGPFGTLDAQGFTATDRGTAMQFAGPGRMVLNGAQGHPAPAPPPPQGLVVGSAPP